MKRHGFTLIELLIVVAIIAILAAIAVPNFLEAQTRSKVSKVRSDMRSLSVALESYKIDYNYYPLNRYTFFDGGAANPQHLRWGQTMYSTGWRLTTPVAYVSSIEAFKSPFGTTVFDHFPDGSWTAKKDTYWYVAGDRATSPMFNTYVNSPISAMYPDATEATMWMLVDAGPERRLAYETGVSLPYDPTNGTVSTGDIYRFGP